MQELKEILEFNYKKWVNCSKKKDEPAMIFGF
jgi:hypothetical protein